MMAVRKLCAKENMASQSKSGVGANGWSRRLATQFNETILERPLDLLECIRAAMVAQGLFGDMSNEIAGIEGGIALAVKVKVDQPQTPALDDDLRGVEITVNAARNRFRNARGQLPASRH